VVLLINFRESTPWIFYLRKRTDRLFFPFCPLHGFNGNYYNFVTALRANISFATSAGKAVATRTV
jgi:hypothetical protein